MNFKKLSAILLCSIFCVAALTGCNTSQPAGLSENSTLSEETSSDQSSSEESSDGSVGSDQSTDEKDPNSSDVSGQSSDAAASNLQSGSPEQSPAPPAQSKSESQPAHQHNYSAQVVAPTCTQNGYTVHTCPCGSQYTDGNTNALGHSWGDWKVISQPTTANEGKKQRVCSRCGVSDTASIPRLESDPSTFAAEVIRLVNAERAKAGLSPLSVVSDLNSYAQLRSTEIVSKFAHERLDGSDPLDYVMNTGKYFTCGENIAMGQRSPEEVMNSWMNSPGHRANILNGNFSCIGVGCCNSNGRLYWVQIFGG